MCDHYPIINNPIWEIVERDMHHIVRRCTLCGQTDFSELTSYSPNMFITEKRRRELTRQRDDHRKDILQPWQNDKPNDEFVKAYENEPEKLKNIYSKKELKHVAPRLAEEKHE